LLGDWDKKENLKIIKKRLSLIIKRIFDILASGVALVVLLPIFAVIGIFIKLDSKGPVFFIQERAGKDGKIFKAYKLGTMVDNAENVGLGYEIAKDDSRITRVGKHLRWGIDELPQLINVFKGEMSLVDSNLLYHIKLKNILIFEKNYY